MCSPWDLWQRELTLAARQCKAAAQPPAAHLERADAGAGLKHAVTTRKRNSPTGGISNLGRALCASDRLAQFLRSFEVDGDELGNPALGHGHTVEPVHARHGDRIMRDDDEPRVGRTRHLVEQTAEALDVVIVKGGINLIEYADWSGVRKKDREDERKCGERLLAAGEQRQRCRLLSRRPRDDLKPGFKGIFAFDELQLGSAASEQLGEQVLEMGGYLLK